MVRYFSLLFILFTPLFGATVKGFNTYDLVHCTFSNRHHNRILVQDGRIGTVIVPEGDILARLETVSGQLFIQAINPYPPVTTISIVTESGEIQDIELHFMEKSSETLVLVPIREEEIACEPVRKEVACEPTFSSVVDGILSGVVPCGYCSISENSELRHLKKCVVAERSGKLISDREIVYVWKVTNHSVFSKRISKDDFSFLNPSWVYIESDRIRGYGQTIAIMGVRLP